MKGCALRSVRAVLSGRGMPRKEWRSVVLRSAVKAALLNGEIIEEYPADYPLPSGLFLGWIKGSALHVVASYDAGAGMAFIITAYAPDQSRFEPDMRTRRKNDKKEI